MTVQDLQFKLMKSASFNSFNGEQVVEDLLAHENLWKGAIMDRAGYNQEIDFIKLRDIEEGEWNVDTLYIKSSHIDDEKLELLAKTWEADEVAWEEVDLGGPREKVLRVWWD